MTLRDQIKQIHAKHFSKEFHEYRQDLIPAMVNDLKLKFFDDLLLEDREFEDVPAYYWRLPNTVEVRAVKLASGLVAATQLRENTPAAE